MSATNTTPNIGLPSFIGTDKPSWLTDWNGAMSTIDTEVGSLKTDLSGDETRIGNLENSVSSLNTTVGNHTTSITALNTQVANQGGTINTITSLIGNGTPTTTDQTIIGAINELHADIRGKYAFVSRDDITVDISGLTTVGQVMNAIITSMNNYIAGLGSDGLCFFDSVTLNGLAHLIINELNEIPYTENGTVGVGFNCYNVTGGKTEVKTFRGFVGTANGYIALSEVNSGGSSFSIILDTDSASSITGVHIYIRRYVALA